MEQSYTVRRIGVLRSDGDGMRVELDQAYAPALEGLEGFGHAHILWWFSGCDDAQARNRLTEAAPYRKGPALMGAFATRAPERPNPIALSCAEVTYLDRENGVLGIAWLDAWDGTPVLDIKPYVPSLDRVERPRVPGWCAHWPNCCEESGDFHWEDEFNF